MSPNLALQTFAIFKKRLNMFSNNPKELLGAVGPVWGVTINLVIMYLVNKKGDQFAKNLYGVLLPIIL